MEIKQITDLTSLFLTFFALVTSLVTFYKIKSDRKTRIYDAHIKFQNAFRTIQKDFPPEVNDTDEHDNYIWTPETAENESLRKQYSRNIDIYWQFVFDEWLFCNKGEKYLKVLWDKYYIYGVKSALKRPAFKNRIIENLNKNGFMLGHKEEYKRVLNQIYFNDTGKNLFN